MHNCKTASRRVEASQSWKSTCKARHALRQASNSRDVVTTFYPLVWRLCVASFLQGYWFQNTAFILIISGALRMFFSNLRCTHALACTASILQTPALCRPATLQGLSEATWFKADWEADCTTEGNLSSKNTTATQRQVTDKLWFCRLKDLAGVTETNEIICHFEENNWQLCLPMIKFEHSSKNQKFGKPVSTATSLTFSNSF